MPPRTFGLLPGQRVLTVPDLLIKRQAQCLGLGVGYLPTHLIEGDIAAGRLIVKETEDRASFRVMVYCAWRTRHEGKALQWFKARLCEEQTGSNWFRDYMTV